MTDSDIEPVDADLDELKDKYPVGTVLLVEKEDDRFDWGQFRAVVTGHAVVSAGKTVKPKYPGPRVNVSTNPPNYERQDPDVNCASALRPCEIVSVEGQIEPTDD